VDRLLFGVSALDPTTFVMVTGVLAAVSTAAALVPARRAARIDPVRAMQTE
jgi:putative ABC transport system permease protein